MQAQPASHTEPCPELLELDHQPLALHHLAACAVYMPLRLNKLKSPARGFPLELVHSVIVWGYGRRDLWKKQAWD